MTWGVTPARVTHASDTAWYCNSVIYILIAHSDAKQQCMHILEIKLLELINLVVFYLCLPHNNYYVAIASSQNTIQSVSAILRIGQFTILLEHNTVKNVVYRNTAGEQYFHVSMVTHTVIAGRLHVRLNIEDPPTQCMILLYLCKEDNIEDPLHSMILLPL